MTKKQLSLLQEIMALRFSVLEFNLYLNTHPQDRTALKKFNEYVEQLRKVCFKYKQEYGPLTANFPSDYPWQYPKTEWPWQIDY